MNKTVKRLTIATVTLLGATYVLKKYKNNKLKKQALIETNKSTDDINELNRQRYIVLNDVYDDVINGVHNSNTTTEKLSDFSSVTGRKYHTLDFSSQREAVIEDEGKEITRKVI